MTHRSNRRGSLMIDRRFPPPIGRIRRASGTTDRKVLQQVDGMLSTLQVQGRWDVLESVKDGTLKPLYVLSLVRFNRLETLPHAATLAPIAGAVAAWLPTLENDEHRRKAAATFRHLGDGRLTDIPKLLQAQRDTMTPRSFNLSRAHAQAFIRDTLGPSHAIWGAIKDIRPRKTTKRKKGRPLPIEEVRAVVAALGTFGPMAWTMCATGMGNNEYWGEWHVEPNHVHVGGTKRPQRVRIVPRWTVLTRPLCGERKFRRELAKASLTAKSPKPVMIYDFRRTFSKWCEAAGIVDSNADAYMGHGPRSMRDLYRMGQMAGQLAADADLLRAYTGETGPRTRLEIA